MERLSKDQYYLNIACIVSKRSTCLRRHYGCVIVKNDEIIATGYNGSPRGEENCCDIGECKRKNMPHNSGDYSLCHAVHAEQNALISAKREDMIGAVLYLAGEDVETGKVLDHPEPCPICNRMIKNAGITEIVSGATGDDIGRNIRNLYPTSLFSAKALTPKNISKYADLPSKGNNIGDFWYCPDGDSAYGEGDYIWDGTSWQYGGIIDNFFDRMMRYVSSHVIDDPYTFIMQAWKKEYIEHHINKDNYSKYANFFRYINARIETMKALPSKPKDVMSEKFNPDQQIIKTIYDKFVRCFDTDDYDEFRKSMKKFINITYGETLLKLDKSDEIDKDCMVLSFAKTTFMVNAKSINGDNDARIAITESAQAESLALLEEFRPFWEKLKKEKYGDGFGITDMVIYKNELSDNWDGARVIFIEGGYDLHQYINLNKLRAIIHNSEYLVPVQLGAGIRVNINKLTNSFDGVDFNPLEFDPSRKKRPFTSELVLIPEVACDDEITDQEAFDEIDGIKYYLAFVEQHARKFILRVLTNEETVPYQYLEGIPFVRDLQNDNFQSLQFIIKRIREDVFQLKMFGDNEKLAIAALADPEMIEEVRNTCFNNMNAHNAEFKVCVQSIISTKIFIVPASYGMIGKYITADDRLIKMNIVY